MNETGHLFSTGGRGTWECGRGHFGWAGSGRLASGPSVSSLKVLSVPRVHKDLEGAWKAMGLWDDYTAIARE